MPWKGLTCLLIVVLGFILFLYGANYYDATIGYVGLGLFIGGIVLYTFLKLYESVAKKQSSARSRRVLNICSSGISGMV